MENKENYVVFSYSKDGTNYTKMNFVIDTEPQNTNAYGGFRALRPGVYACNEGIAHFEYFRLSEM